MNKCLAGYLDHCLGQWFSIKPAWSSLRWLINRVIPASSLPSCDVVGQRKGAGIHIFNNCPVGLDVGALWVSRTGERNCSGGYGISEVWGKSFSRSGSFPCPWPTCGSPMMASSFPCCCYDNFPSLFHPDYCHVHFDEDHILAVSLVPPDNDMTDHTPWSYFGIVQIYRVARMPCAY